MPTDEPSREATLIAEVAELRAQVEKLSQPARVTSEPLTYERHAPFSYFQDRLLVETQRDERSVSARARLERHAQEMDVLGRDADRQALGRLDRAGVEYRVTPGATAQGTGGWFSAPKYLVDLFATAPRTGRVLSALMQQFDLPAGASQIVVPFISTGADAQPHPDNAAVASADLADGGDRSPVATIAGMVDTSLQLLQQSPGAHLDFAVFEDLNEQYVQTLEQQLIYGNGNVSSTGPGNDQLIGVMTRTAVNTVTYTNGSPTDVGVYNAMGQAAARVGNNRHRPPECWLMRTARWAWMGASTDSVRPFNLPTARVNIGVADPTMGYIVGSVFGWPVFCDDAIPQTFSGNSQQPGGGTQDAIIALRPSDLILLEGSPRVLVSQEPASGTLGVRIRLHRYTAAITGRRNSGVVAVVGTGLAVQSGYSA